MDVRLTIALFSLLCMCLRSARGLRTRTQILVCRLLLVLPAPLSLSDSTTEKKMMLGHWTIVIGNLKFLKQTKTIDNYETSDSPYRKTLIDKNKPTMSSHFDLLERKRNRIQNDYKLAILLHACIIAKIEYTRINELLEKKLMLETWMRPVRRIKLAVVHRTHVIKCTHGDNVNV